MNTNIKKIAVIGNSCSGKTTCSRELAKAFSLPIFHVDSVQYLPKMQWRDPNETRKILSEIAQKEEWIIDGIGPLKILEERLQRADLIVVLRPSLAKIYFWLVKRQIKGLFSQRKELPEDCFESTPTQTFKLIKTIWNVNAGLWPQLDRILQRDIYKSKVVTIKNKRDVANLIISYAKN